MSDTNTRTLEAYNKGVQTYIESTGQKTSGTQKDWLDFVFKAVPEDAKILEIGSAFGRDASYLIEQGYNVTMTDGSGGFVDYLNEHGFVASKLDIVNQQPKDIYDVILACAVFLHFDRDDFKKAVGHVKNALTIGGSFAFSLKQGEGEEWSESKIGLPRYFNYWKKDQLSKVMEGLGMKITDLRVLEEGKWLHVVAIKTQ